MIYFVSIDVECSSDGASSGCCFSRRSLGYFNNVVVIRSYEDLYFSRLFFEKGRGE